MVWISRLFPLRQLVKTSREPLPALVSAPESRLPAAHIPQLDAVRGLAILLVTLYRFAGVEPTLPGADHWLFRVLAFGDRGVDLFFVLSGFLITGILFDSKRKPGYFRNFYMRRSLRIFPLYYGALLLFLVVLPLALGTSYAFFPEAREKQAWLWLYGANVLQGATESWNLGYFNHFWSLAVEEHFYFVWPLVIFACTRKQALWACGLTVLFAVVARTAWVLTTCNDVAMDVWTPFRLDGLALGGLLALLVRGPGGISALVPYARLVAIITGGMIGGMLLLPFGRLLGLPFTLYALFCGSLIILAVSSRRETIFGRFWHSRILRFFGKYSYGMYVFQSLLIPLLAGIITVASLNATVGSPFLARLVYIALMTAATICVSLASWHLYEKHFSKLKHRFGG